MAIGTLKDDAKTVSTHPIEKQIGKKEVVERAWKLGDLPKDEMRKAATAVLTALYQLLEEADPEVRIYLRALGTFEVTYAAPTCGYDFAKEERITIPTRRRVSYRPKEALRKTLKRPVRDLGYEDPYDYEE